MPERLLSALKGAAWVVGAVVALALWGARLEFAVGQRVTHMELQATRDSVNREFTKMERILERLDERTARIDRYICRQRPNDVGC